MLQSVYIEKLFGLYTYTLNLAPKENAGICFITGPNGYGKTTILNMLESIFNCNFKNLLKPPFDKITLQFEDGCTVGIKQNRSDYLLDSNTDVDLSSVPNADSLDITFYDPMTKETIVKCIKNKAGKTKKNNDPIVAYLKSHPVYYIRDSRLNKDKNTSAVRYNADKLQTILNDCHDRINSYKLDAQVLCDPIGEGSYELCRSELKEDIDTALSCGIIDKDPLLPYDANRLSEIMTVYHSTKMYLDQEHNLLERLRAFQYIIKTCDFADKDMQLGREYGYRFVLNDEVNTKLLPDTLSSGEQHTLIMFFDLLFSVDDASIVLIDEPELSFHLALQLNFLDYLRKVSSLRKLQCIVCTHSPRIFDGDFDLTVDLYEQSKVAK